MILLEYSQEKWAHARGNSYTNVHRSVTQNSRQVEATQMPIQPQTHVLHPHTEGSFDHKEEWGSDTCSPMDEPGDPGAEKERPDAEGHACGSTAVRCLAPCFVCSLLRTPVPPHWQPVTNEQLAPPAGGTVNHDFLREPFKNRSLRTLCTCFPSSAMNFSLSLKSCYLLQPLAIPSPLYSEHSARGMWSKWNETGRVVVQGSV